MTTFTTIGGWATIAAVAGGLYYISSRNERSRRPPVKQQVQKAVESTKGKAKKAKKAVVQGNADSDVKSGSEKRKDKKPVASKAEPQRQSYAAVADDGDDEVDNREFARQLEAAKVGKSFTQQSKTENRAKSVKQNKAHDKPAVEQKSDNLTASSTNGADGDDDQSPIQSPNVSTSYGGGVADMLEKPAAGPSVLKISAPTQPAPVNKKSKKQEEPVETKKARQNKQKAEAAKAQRAADEIERQKLMEQQRRTARIAEGRAAKDGSSFQASQAPASNSWAVPPPTTNGTSATNEKVQLLDTAEELPANGITKSQDSNNWNTSISEEDQIRILNENESWETVKKDKKTRQKNVAKPVENSVVETAKDLASQKKPEVSEPPITYAAAPVRFNDNRKPAQQIELEEDEWEVS